MGIVRHQYRLFLQITYLQNTCLHSFTKWQSCVIMLCNMHSYEKIFTNLYWTVYPRITPENYATVKNNLAIYNKILKKTIRNAKKSHYEFIFEKYKNDNKKTWNLINNILNKSKGKKPYPKFFKENNQIIIDKSKIANRFNEYFINIGEKLVDDIDENSQKCYKDFLNKYDNLKFDFSPVEEQTIIKVINNLSSKDSYGIDGISTTLLKYMKHILAKPLSIIINQTLKTGVFPDKLKIAKVTLVYKKGNENTFCNDRPISLLPSISKVFEKVMCNQLTLYFETNHFLMQVSTGFGKITLLSLLLSNWLI